MEAEYSKHKPAIAPQRNTDVPFPESIQTRTSATIENTIQWFIRKPTFQQKHLHERIMKQKSNNWSLIQNTMMTNKVEINPNIHIADPQTRRINK